jgi:TRAP transporter TAXI family solute receptor
VAGTVRTVGTDEETPPRARLIAFVTLVSLVTVIACALKVIGGFRPVRLRVATGAKGSEYNSFGEALKYVIETHHPRLRLELVTDTEGSRDSVMRLQRGDVDLALAQNDTPARESVRSIALLFEEVFHLYVREDSGITRADQLIGRRIATLREGSGTNCFFHDLIAHFTPEGAEHAAEVHCVDPNVAHAMFRAGQVDAVFHIVALGQTAKDYVGPSLAGGARLLPLEQISALALTHPFLEQAVIPKGFYRGYPPEPLEDVATAAVRAVLLVHRNVDERMVREITRILHAHRNELVNRSPLAAAVRRPDKPEEILFPLHAGAQAFYDREKPGFLLTHADLLALSLSVAVLCVSGLWQLQLRLERHKKDRADRYNLEIVELVDRLRGTEDPCEIREVRQGLFDIFKRVLHDVADDKISTESFQLFAFPWEMAIEATRHRESVLGCPPRSDQEDRSPPSRLSQKGPAE